MTNAKAAGIDLMNIDMDALVRVIRPSRLADGAHQIMLPVYNTQVMVKVYPGGNALSDAELDDALVGVRELAIEFEMSLSRTRPESEVSRLNDARGEWVDVSEKTFDLIDKSRAYCEASGGVFDVTMGSVTPLWDFHNGVVPDRAELDEALRHVDWHMVEVDRDRRRVRLADPVARLDLGGIAKGFIADELAAYLVGRGCDCAFVNLGGNVLTVGARPNGAPWRIGVRDPKDPESMRAVVTVTGQSVVTSGLYERNFTKDGVFYHHILSTSDGMPVKTDVGGATIVSTLSLDGDGFSTTLFALGMDGAIDFVEKTEGIEAILIGLDGDVRITSGLQGRVQLIETTS